MQDFPQTSRSLPHHCASALVEVLHEDGELAVGVAELAGHRLPLQNEGADLHEVLIALHAFVVPTIV